MAPDIIWSIIFAGLIILVGAAVWTLRWVAQSKAVGTRLQILQTCCNLGAQYIDGWWTIYKPLFLADTATSKMLGVDVRKKVLQDAWQAAKDQAQHIAPMLVNQAEQGVKNFLDSRLKVLSATVDPPKTAGDIAKAAEAAALAAVTAAATTVVPAVPIVPATGPK